MIQWLAMIGEEGENKWELTAATTDTLPTTKNNLPLTPGSFATLYVDNSTQSGFKRFGDVVGTGNTWLPFGG